MSQAAGDVKIIFAVDSTSYSAALDKMRSQLKQFSGEATSAGRAGAAAGHGMVAPWQASSAALRVAEGNMTNNIRAAERFLATIPGVGRALQVAFPVVGAIALLGVFGRMTSEVTKFIKETNRIPGALATAFREVEVAGQMSADELQKENDLLDNQIAKLEGKRQNNLAIALDDARIAADKLEQSLMRDNQQVAEILKKNEIGWLRELTSGRNATTDLAGTVDYWNQELADKAKALDDAMHQFGPGTAETKAAQAELDQRRADAEAAMRNQILARQPGGTPDIMAARLRGNISLTGDDQSANLSIARQYLSVLQGQDRVEQKTAYGNQRQGVADALKHAKELLGSQKEAAAQRMQQAREQLEAQKAAHTMTIDDEAAYWQRLADSAGRGSVLYNSALTEANRARATSLQQFQHSIVAAALEGQEAARQQAEADQRLHENLAENYTAQDARDREAAKQLEENAVKAFEAAEQQRKAADRIAEETIKLREASGQLSRAGAAQALQALHEESFAGWSAAAASFSAQLPNVALPGAARALQEYGTQSAQDQAAMQAATALGALHEATDKLTQAFLDLPAHLQELLTATVSGFNSAFSGAVMAHATSGVEYRRGITNAIGGQFRSAGTRGLDTALQLGEGGLLSKLGKGAKPTGSASDPLWVRLAAGAAAVSGAGELLSSTGAGSLLLAAMGARGPAGTSGAGAGNPLSTMMPALTALIPHFAAGGPIPSNMPSLVGENGPELFMPSTAGRIVPNNALGGGGGDTHLHIDARGATDPAAVEFAVNRAINRAMRQVPAMAIGAVRSYNRARPGTSKV